MVIGRHAPGTSRDLLEEGSNCCPSSRLQHCPSVNARGPGASININADLEPQDLVVNASMYIQQPELSESDCMLRPNIRAKNVVKACRHTVGRGPGLNALTHWLERPWTDRGKTLADPIQADCIVIGRDLLACTRAQIPGIGVDTYHRGGSSRESLETVLKHAPPILNHGVASGGCGGMCNHKAQPSNRGRSQHHQNPRGGVQNGGTSNIEL